MYEWLGKGVVINLLSIEVYPRFNTICEAIQFCLLYALLINTGKFYSLIELNIQNLLHF